MCSTRSAWTDGSRRAAIIAPRVALRSVYIYPENRNPSHLFINFSFRACLRDLDRSPCLLLHRPYSRPMHANVLVFLSGADSDIFALSFPPFFPHVLAVSMRFGSPVEFFFLCVLVYPQRPPFSFWCPIPHDFLLSLIILLDHDPSS